MEKWREKGKTKYPKKRRLKEEREKEREVGRVGELRREVASKSGKRAAQNRGKRKLNSFPRHYPITFCERVSVTFSPSYFPARFSNLTDSFAFTRSLFPSVFLALTNSPLAPRMHARHNEEKYKLWPDLHGLASLVHLRQSSSLHPACFRLSIPQRKKRRFPPRTSSVPPSVSFDFRRRIRVAAD